MILRRPWRNYFIRFCSAHSPSNNFSCWECVYRWQLKRRNKRKISCRTKGSQNRARNLLVGFEKLSISLHFLIPASSYIHHVGEESYIWGKKVRLHAETFFFLIQLDGLMGKKGEPSVGYAAVQVKEMLKSRRQTLFWFRCNFRDSVATFHSLFYFHETEKLMHKKFRIQTSQVVVCKIEGTSAL